MTKKKMIPCSLVSLCLSCLLAVTMLPAYAYAIDYINLDRACSLVVSGVPADVDGGANVSLYRVASVSKAGDEYTASGRFADYPVDLNGRDPATPWGDGMAQTLAGYVERDNLEALVQGRTNAEGFIRFNDLEVGLYLGVVESVFGEGVRYEFAPFLVQVPNLIMEDGVDTWIYDDIVVCPKHQDTSITDLSVVKVWKDAAAVEAGIVERPTAVMVQLLCDGEIVDEVQLSARNNWRQTWENLASEHTWRIVEKTACEGYTVTVDREGAVFTVTNAAPDPADSLKPEDPKLPQTSVLWWPVPALLVLGGGLVVAGRMRRGSRTR